MRSRGVGAATVLALAMVVPLAAGCQPPPESVRVEIVIRYSHFTPTEITVPHGVPVRFVLVSQDPIEHEWLIGDAAFHERHRTGTEPHHGARPDEVTIPPLGTAETTLTFDEPGEVAFICHVPGHEAYGMVGVVRVT
jgi:uncharacterized cupredoxin-like copper-binding protein